MKNCKKLGVLLLALIMVTTSGVMSFADGDAAAGSGAETAIAPAAETAAGGEQTESQDSTVSDDAGAGETDEHPHNTVNCKTCKGTGKTPIPDDMTLYEKAYEEFEILAVQDNSKSTVENALEYLENQGLDVTEDFAREYAVYMMRHADKVWCIDQIKTHGDAYNWVMGNYGSGTEDDTIAYLESLMPVAPFKIAGYSDCSDCEDGKIPCAGEFDEEGVLTSVNDNGTGVVTHTCNVCDASYFTEMTAENVTATLTENLEISGLIAEFPGAQRKGIIDCTIEVKNKGTCPVSGIKLNLKLGNGLGLKSKNPVKVDPKAYHVEIKESEIELELAEVKPGKKHKITVSTKIPPDADIGTMYNLTLESATFRSGTNENGMILPEKNVATVRANKYTKCKVYIAGHNMGYYYGGNLSDNKNATSSVRLDDLDSTILDLDKLEGKKFRFENFTYHHTSFSTPDENGCIINNATQRKWQCVGFVPGYYNYSDPGAGDLKALVFSNTGNRGFAKVNGMDEVKTFIENNKGVLYGASISATQFDAWENMYKDGVEQKIYVQSVWYVEDKDVEPVANKTLSIEPVILGTDDSTVECDAENIKGWVTDEHEFYEADLVVNIGENAPSKVHVNLSKALAKAAQVFNADPRKAVQPGDTIKYRVIIKNESGKTYTYTKGSGVIATRNTIVGSENDLLGFDGFKLSQVSEKMSNYARRTNNAPLKELGLKNRTSISDERIGAKLRELGYGVDDEDLTDAAITKKYLGNYYLDWTNSVRASKGEPSANGFQDLTVDELAVFTNGDDGEVIQETCPTVIEALYYFYYAGVLTFNEKSPYEQMGLCKSGNSELETEIPAALEGTPYPITVTVDLFAANNAFQDTKFGTRIEFDLKAPDPEPTPTPDPTPTPTPTPDPTPEPDPTPDPQPLPPDDPLEEPDKPTVDPQPLPPDDPLIEDEDPKQPLPEDEHLADPDQPKTGDESDLALWLGVMILASGAVVTMRVKRKKEDQN